MHVHWQTSHHAYLVDTRLLAGPVRGFQHTHRSIYLSFYPSSTTIVAKTAQRRRQQHGQGGDLSLKRLPAFRESVRRAGSRRECDGARASEEVRDGACHPPTPARTRRSGRWREAHTIKKRNGS
jgi:hypothetical protein